jgi:N-acetylneuraminic acid mutarotase
MEEDLPLDDNGSLEGTDGTTSAVLQPAAIELSSAAQHGGFPVPPNGVDNRSVALDPNSAAHSRPLPAPHSGIVILGAPDAVEIRPPMARAVAARTASLPARSAAASAAVSPLGANRQSLLRLQAHSPAAGPPNRSLQRQDPRPPSPVVSIASYRGQQAGPPRALHAEIHRDENLDRDMRSLSMNNLALSISAPESEMGEDPNILATASGWSHVEPGTDGAPPSSRSLHSAALLNGSIYIFGGYSGTERVNSFFAYSMVEKRWCPVLPAANSAPPPSPRDRHVAVAFGNSIYIHGGFDGISRIGDLWEFNLSTMTWRQVVGLHGRAPSPRHSHAAVVHGHRIFLFGGYDGSYKSDLHEYDITSSRWNQVPAAGRRPRARYRATCVVHKNQIILFAGHDGTRHLNDLHVFDIDTSTWSSLVTEGTTPIPRDSHVSVVHNNSMYVFGGSSGSAMNDLHELQLPPNSTNPARWRPVNTTRNEQPEPRFCHVAVVYNDSIWAFGGYSGNERLGDFIRFDLAVYDLSFEVPPSTIISDFQAMINDSTLSDVTFVVDGQAVYAHKLMLMRCSYFRALFLGEMIESRQATIRIEQVPHSIFLSVLEYLYTDQLRISLNNAMDLFEAADLFCIPRLKTMCEKRMLQSINVENAASIFLAADMHSASALRQKTRKYILSHFEEVSKSYSFEEMGRNNIELVFELLQSR